MQGWQGAQAPPHTYTHFLASLTYRSICEDLLVMEICDERLEVKRSKRCSTFHFPNSSNIVGFMDLTLFNMASILYITLLLTKINMTS